MLYPPKHNHACQDLRIRILRAELSRRTRKLRVGVTWDVGRDDEDPDRSAIGVELGRDIVVALRNQHIVS